MGSTHLQSSRAGGNPDSNTLISDSTTVICLDDYHSLDRYGRKEQNVTALDPKAQDFDLMYDQVLALKEGKSVDKPIYNHVTGLLDAPETIKAPKAGPPCWPHAAQAARPNSHSCVTLDMQAPAASPSAALQAVCSTTGQIIA